MSLQFFYNEQPLTGGFVTLDEATSRHIVQVLRMKQNEHLLLTDGKGSLHKAEIQETHKKRCTVHIVSSEEIPPRERKVSTAIGLLKNTTRLEWFIEKATEIGVYEIIPLVTKRTEKQRLRLDRMQQVVVAAMLQSRQVWMPVLHEPIELEQAINNSSYNDKLVAHCEEAEKLDIRKYRSSSSVQVLIGPEGDFTHDEIALALQHGFRPVTLGGTRLRTETAGIVAASILCV